MPDLFDTAPRQTRRGHIDSTIGQGNGRFLGHVANGMARAELERRFRAGEYPDLNADIARNAMGTTHHQERGQAREQQMPLAHEDGIRFLVPGCWNRAVYGDDAMCHCPNAKKPAAEELEDRVERLEAVIAELRANQGAPA